MRVLFLARSDLYKVPGGDTVQIDNTASELRKLGVEVNIITNLNVNINDYDLVHVFQLDWVPETYFYVKKAKEFKKPIVLSPIHHSEMEVKMFDDLYAFGLRKVVGFFVRKQEHRDILKNVYRSFYNKAKFIPTLKSALLGYRKLQRKALELSDIVLVQTNREAKDLQDTYNINFRWEKVVNGVSEQFLNCKEFENKLPFKDYVICVGRIEARKNQLNIIKAMKLVRQEKGFENVKLVFIGRKSSHHKSYVSKFDKELKNNDWIIHPGYVAQEDLPNYYHFAKVCVSASWFESTGLTSLEALFCGVNVVASGERAKELLGDLAVYCNPWDVLSIKEAIIKSFSMPQPKMPESFKLEYTWENAAKKTLEIYAKL